MRVFKTYTEADIRDAPAMHAMTDQLARDMPADADPRVKGTLGHNNFRADPELQRDGKCIIAVRRLACACDGCRAAFKRPIATRYSPHDNCVRAESFERRNDWKLVELKPANGVQRGFGRAHRGGRQAGAAGSDGRDGVHY